MEENEAENDAIDSSSEAHMVGFLVVDIVGLYRYQDTISSHEIVGLVRDPDDRTAIKVLDMRTVQVGYLRSSVAAVLSPLIDAGLIAIEGVVAKQQEEGSRLVPCQVHIYAKIEEFERVKQAIATGGLQLNSENKASLRLSRETAVEEKKSVGAENSVDEIFKLLDLKVSNKGTLKALAPPKEIIKTELLPHQKEALGWLVSRENSCELPPFWKEKNGVYVNVLTKYISGTKPEPLRGGIFADDMGLGKTLTLISLIAFDKWINAINSSRNVDVEDDEELGEEEESIAGINSKRSRGTKENENSRKKGPAFDRISDSEPKPTLVVCPPSVLSSWITQVEEHTQEGTFKVYTYYDMKSRDEEVAELQKHDIVLTSYSTIANAVRNNSPIHTIEWRRVILDEAHIIKTTTSSSRGRAVAKLNAKRKWAVTGTPIQKSASDLFPLVWFLKIEPFSSNDTHWNSLIQRHLAEVNEKGPSRLQVLMEAISLRRTKDKCLVDLPSKTMETCFVELGEEERRVYDQIEAKAKQIGEGYISGVVKNYCTVLGILVRLRQICTDLALCPADLLLQSSQIEDVTDNPALLKKFLSILQDEDLECSICLFPPKDTVITLCSHIFCESCILKALETKRTCPLCRQALQKTELFKSPPDSSQTSSFSTSSSSCKVTALLKLLSASRDENPLRKSVIFTQFRKMLLLLEKPLKQAGFKVVRLDGTMDAKRRARVIKEFGGKGGPTILLASVNASYVGINLTAASRVYLMEPFVNQAVEEQAIDRVHRIGQKEDVKIVRLIARNSIEERMLEMQQKKGVNAKKVFVTKGSKDQKEINRDDLRTLMNLE